MTTQELQTLKSRVYVKNKYRPPTGIGEFDFRYNPTYTQSEGLVEATVKCHLRFMLPSDDHKDVGKQTWQAWTENEKAHYRKRLKEIVQEVWTNKYRFVCQEPGANGLSARVSIKLEEATPQAAGYIVKLRKVQQTEESAWSGGCEHALNPYEANFSNWGIEPRENFNGAGIFEFKYKQLQTALSDSGAFLIPMDHKAVDIDETAKQKLRAFCAAAARVVSPNLTEMYCNVVGLSTEVVGNSRANARAKAITSALARYTNIQGFFQADTSSAGRKIANELLRKKNLTPGKYSGVALYIAVPPKAPRLFHTNYVVFAHEFGHMLGCPDEYFGILCSDIKAKMDLDTLAQVGVLGQTPKAQYATTDEQRRQQQQQAMAKQIGKTGVEVPVFQTAQGFALNARDQADNLEARAREMDLTRQRIGAGDENRAKRQAHMEKWDKQNPSVAKIMGASSSIMFSGMDVMAAHYLPIWNCLADETKPFFNRSQWKIEPVA